MQVVLANILGRAYTMLDRINFFRGVCQSLDILLPELYGLDLFAQVPEVQVPVYFCLGRHDREVPSELAARERRLDPGVGGDSAMPRPCATRGAPAALDFFRALAPGGTITKS